MGLTLLNLENESMSSVVAVQREAARVAARTDAKRELTARRQYEAARVSRLTSDFSTASTTANSELRTSLLAMRNRCRTLARDNCYVKKFLSLCRTNVVGHTGISLQVRAKKLDGTLDTDLNKQIEDAFYEWTFKENCSASGKLDWLEAQRLFITQLARDGEVLIQKVAVGNKFGIALKFLDVAWLDENYNDVLPDGNRVLMSVEVDKMDRPVAYYLTPPRGDYLSQEFGGAFRQRTRVPASEMIHAYVCTDDESQTRGVPWTATAVAELNQIHAYKQAEVIAARIEASTMGFLKKSLPDGDAYDDEENAPLEFDLEPATFKELPAGVDVEMFDPKRPNQNFGAFVETVLHGVAASFDVPYFALNTDLKAVNFSSARIGLLEARDVWRASQAFVIAHFCREVYQSFVKSALLAGGLQIKARDYARVKEPFFRGRSWGWVDPGKDVNASIDAINAGLDTYTDVLAEKGVDFVEHLETLAAERKLAESFGVNLNAGAAEASAFVPAADPADTDSMDSAE